MTVITDTSVGPASLISLAVSPLSPQAFDRESFATNLPTMLSLVDVRLKVGGR